MENAMGQMTERNSALDELVDFKFLLEDEKGEHAKILELVAVLMRFAGVTADFSNLPDHPVDLTRVVGRTGFAISAFARRSIEMSRCHVISQAYCDRWCESRGIVSWSKLLAYLQKEIPG